MSDGQWRDDKGGEGGVRSGMEDDVLCLFDVEGEEVCSNSPFCYH